MNLKENLRPVSGEENRVILDQDQLLYRYLNVLMKIETISPTESIIL